MIKKQEKYSQLYWVVACTSSIPQQLLYVFSLHLLRILLSFMLNCYLLGHETTNVLHFEIMKYNKSRVEKQTQHW